MQVLDTVAFDEVEGVPFVLQRGSGIAADDWSPLIAFLHRRDAMSAMIVVAGRGSISADQRRDVRSLYERYGMKIGVILESQAARGVVTALGWFGVPIKAFSPTDLPGLIRYIDRPELHDAIAEVVTPFLPGGHYRDAAS